MPRPNKRIISREHAAEAALAVIDENGLEDFKLNTVADRLGIRTPSLYHYFSGRNELLVEVARLLLVSSALTPIDEVSNWREEVVRVSRESWRSILRHPHAAPLLLQLSPRVIMSDAYEYWLRLFTSVHIPVNQQMVILEGTDKLTYGSALFAAAEHLPTTDTAGSISANQSYLSAAPNANLLDPEEIFVETIRTFLRGIDTKEGAAI